MIFKFKQFSLQHDKSTLKIGTDSVLLASAVPIFNAQKVLDIGCGCGVILFCTAFRLRQQKGLPQLFVGIDIDEDSVAEAGENIANFPKKDEQQIEFFQSSLQKYSENHSDFDLILSNPPYFSNCLSSPNEKNQRSKHLDGNLSFLELAQCVKMLLAEKGVFYLILPSEEMIDFRKTALQIGLYEVFEMQIIPVEGKTVNRIIAGFSRVYSELFIQYLTIRNKNLDYHPDYKEITKEFYLNF